MPDTDFVQRLRMNNIFPSGGSNPLGAPEIGGGGADINHILNSVMAFKNNQRMQDSMDEENRYARAKGDRLAEIARQAAINQQQRDSDPLRPQGGMNVVMGHDPNQLTAYQKAQLAFNREKLGDTSDIARAKLEQAGDIGGRKLDISQQRANTYSSMHNLSDAEKIDIMNRARAGDIQARGQVQQMLQEDKDEASMARTQANIGGRANVASIQQAGATSRNNATIEGNIDRDKSKAVGDYIFKNPQDKPDVTTSSERTVTQGDSDPIVTKTTTTKGKDPKSGNPFYSIKPEATAKPGAAPTGDKGGIKVMVNGQPMTIDDYNADPAQQSSDGRKNAAIQILQNAGKPLTPANIEHIMKQL